MTDAPRSLSHHLVSCSLSVSPALSPSIFLSFALSRFLFSLALSCSHSPSFSLSLSRLLSLPLSLSLSLSLTLACALARSHACHNQPPWSPLTRYPQYSVKLCVVASRPAAPLSRTRNPKTSASNEKQPPSSTTPLLSPHSRPKLPSFSKQPSHAHLPQVGGRETRSF
jgi:hypothetical protein